MTSDDTGMGGLTNRAQELARGIHATYQKLCDTAADRNEWRTQHENLLAIYRSQTEQVAALIEQRDRLLERGKITEAALNHCGLDLALMRQQRDQLAGAMHRYASHDEGCPKKMDSLHTCTCGFVAALALGNTK